MIKTTIYTIDPEPLRIMNQLKLFVRSVYRDRDL